MAKSTLGILSIIIGAALIFNPCEILGAEKPEIQIVLEFAKKVYTIGEPIGAKVRVIHHSGKNLLLSRGFSELDFLVEMRIIDPAKRLVLARHCKIHNEFPDAPPLPFILYKEEPARAIPCETLPADKAREVKNEDIRNHYALELPGEYSAQIQISVATFEGEPCNTKNYRWLGVLTSNTEIFYIEPTDNKKQAAELSSPNRNLTLKEKITIDRQARLSEVDTKIIKTNAPKNFQLVNTKSAIEPLTWRKNAPSIPGIKMLDSHLPANTVVYDQSGPQILDFKTISLTANDSDGDGISDETEIKLHTNKNVKTLFVRPKIIQGWQLVYWPGFINLFPDPRAGFAKIPAFANAGIEISVIGASNHPYVPMRRFDYDPADPNIDPNNPACDILEIIHMPDGLYCFFGSHNFGHTYFYSIGATWYWDTKGYVPNDQVSDHYKKYGYFTPYIYPFPLDNYLREGAYDLIEAGQAPMATTGCGLRQCYYFNHSSPLNLNASNPVHGRPDGTVEFNAITFDSTSKQITFVGPFGTPYDRDTVLKRTIVHEMGHALLSASEGDHCNDPECIMYHSVADWRPWEFGPPASSGRSCTHSAGYIRDIRAPGVIHNSVH
jgi:hypothetical protein